MDFSPNKHHLKKLEKVGLEVLILETLILVLMKNGTKIHGKNLIS